MAEANEELKVKIVAWFEKKSSGDKKKFYMQDVVKAFREDYKKREIQKTVNALTVDGDIMYWSSGSTTMLVLSKYFRD